MLNPDEYRIYMYLVVVDLNVLSGKSFDEDQKFVSIHLLCSQGEGNFDEVKLESNFYPESFVVNQLEDLFLVYGQKFIYVAEIPSKPFT